MPNVVQYSDKLQAILSGKEFKLAAAFSDRKYRLNTADFGLELSQYTRQDVLCASPRFVGFVDQADTKGGQLVIALTILGKRAAVTVDVHSELELLD